MGRNCVSSVPSALALKTATFNAGLVAVSNNLPAERVKHSRRRIAVADAGLITYLGLLR